MAAIVSRSNCIDFPSEKRLDGMIEGTIASIDDSLHNLDYHELKNAEGEALRLCGGSA
ncbi:hypothetical protein [Ellagibacter isourolithinifaciens]|uniref:hypothetical protein n=1 Tax=Ellagibacter isourolithinifaciens TaxID=2137581 RepID=UPI003AF0D7DB